MVKYLVVTRDEKGLKVVHMTNELEDARQAQAQALDIYRTVELFTKEEPNEK